MRSTNYKPSNPPSGRTREDIPSWELLDTGRYMPRRTRGSFPGRELG
jgi:hypothetical protein